MRLFEPEDRHSSSESFIQKAREERNKSSSSPINTITFRDRNNQRDLSVIVSRDTGTQQGLREAFLTHVDNVKNEKQQNCQLLFDNIFSDPNVANFHSKTPDNPTEAIQNFTFFADFILKYWYFLQKDYVDILSTFFEITSEEKLKQSNSQRVGWLLETLILHRTAHQMEEANYQKVKQLHTRFINILSGPMIDNSYTRTKVALEKSFHSTLRDKCFSAIGRNQNNLSLRGKKIVFFHISSSENIFRLPSDDMLFELYGNKCKEVLIFSGIPAEKSIQPSSPMRDYSRTFTEFCVETAKTFGLWINATHILLVNFLDTPPVIPAIQSVGGEDETRKEEITSSNAVQLRR